MQHDLLYFMITLNTVQPEAWTRAQQKCASCPCSSHRLKFGASSNLPFSIIYQSTSPSFTFKSCLCLAPFFSFLILKDLIPPFYGLTMRKKRSEEHTSELQSPDHLVCRLLLE